MTPTIPDEAVEVAARAMWQHGGYDLTWERLDPDIQETVRAETRAALTAAAPMMVGWRKIEGEPDTTKAPWDGEPVDLWTKSWGRIPNVQWRRGADVDPERCGPGGIWEHLAQDGWRHIGDKEGCGCLAASQFTHWQPLPSAPRDAGLAEVENG